MRALLRFSFSVNETMSFRFVNIKNKLNEIISFLFGAMLSKRINVVNVETAQNSVEKEKEIILIAALTIIFAVFQPNQLKFFNKGKFIVTMHPFLKLLLLSTVKTEFSSIIF